MKRFVRTRTTSTRWSSHRAAQPRPRSKAWSAAEAFRVSNGNMLRNTSHDQLPGGCALTLPIHPPRSAGRMMVVGYRGETSACSRRGSRSSGAGRSRTGPRGAAMKYSASPRLDTLAKALLDCNRTPEGDSQKKNFLARSRSRRSSRPPRRRAAEGQNRTSSPRCRARRASSAEYMKNSVELALDHLGRKMGGLDIESLRRRPESSPRRQAGRRRRCLKKQQVDSSPESSGRTSCSRSRRPVTDAGKIMVGTKRRPARAAGSSATSCSSHFVAERRYARGDGAR